MRILIKKALNQKKKHKKYLRLTVGFKRRILNYCVMIFVVSHISNIVTRLKVSVNHRVRKQWKKKFRKPLKEPGVEP